MAKYIKQITAIRLIENYGKAAISDGQTTLDTVDSIVELTEAVKSIPAADVVEVVRCRDCCFWDFGRCEGIENGLIREYTKPDDFCSYGKRKEHTKEK